MKTTAARLPPRLRAYGHVLQSRLRRGGGTPPAPHASHLLVTWRCNLRCWGCDAWQRPPDEELDAAEWAAVFRQLPFLDILKIIGGEPFVREDLAEIVLAVRRQIDPFVVQLVTNATLTDRVVRFVEDHAWPALHLRLSLDGLQDTHDRARGMDGTFEQVMETMRAVSALRRKRRFQLAVNFTLTDESRGDLQPLIEQCRRLGVDVVAGFKVKPFLKHCDIRHEKPRTVALTDHDGALRQLRARDNGARAGFNALEKTVLRTFNRSVFGKHAAGGTSLKFRCGELRSLMYLNPAGELITCGLNQVPIGSIARDGFDTVWHSAAAAAARTTVRDCPGCLQGAVEIMSKVYGS